METTRAKDFYTPEKFKLTLVAAEKLAEGEVAENFVSDMRERYEKWGADMFLSQKQADWLERISGG